MKYGSISVIIGLFIVSAGSLAALDLQVKLPLTVKNYGTMEIAVYTNTEHFLDYEEVHRSYSFPIDDLLKKGRTISFYLGGLTVGSEYAIAVFLDQNQNDSFDRTRITGLPLEAYGFSKNPVLFGKPSFESCAFIYRSTSEVTIVLRPPALLRAN